MNSVEFLKGKEATNVFTFNKKGHTNVNVNVEICKKETEELTYKLMIKYLGPPKGKRNTSWIVLINGKMPLDSNGRPLCYLESKKFDVRPYGFKVLEIEETNEKETGKILIDLSGRSPVVIDELIQNVMEKVKLFKTSDEKKVEKVFYNKKVGIIIYARDEKWARDIYFAGKDNGKFVKTNSEMTEYCRCSQGNSKWKVKLPNEDNFHIFKFAQGKESERGHSFETFQDEVDLLHISIKTCWDNVDLQHIPFYTL